MSYYLWELRPYFRQVAGQLVLGSLAGFIMNTTVVLPAILLGRAINAARAFERGDVGAGAVGWAALAFVGGTLLTEVPRIAKRWWLMTANARTPTPLAGVFAVKDQDEPDPQEGEIGAQASDAARRRRQPQLEPAPTRHDEGQDAYGSVGHLNQEFSPRRQGAMCMRQEQDATDGAEPREQVRDPGARHGGRPGPPLDETDPTRQERRQSVL